MLACVLRQALMGVALLLPCLAAIRSHAANESPTPATEPSSAARSPAAAWQIEPTWEEGAVTALLQTHDGYLWLGTYHGLVRFDGATHTVFDASNTPELQNAVITSLFETTNGVLWIGHETGHLTRFADGRFHPEGLGTNWPGGAVEGITTDEKGDLWLLSTPGVLWRLKDGLSLPLPGSGPANRKFALARAPDGRNWITADGKLAILENGALSPFAFPGDPPGEYYERILPAREGGLWVVSSGRVRRWNAGQWLELGETGLRLSGAVTALLESHSGALLAGTLADGLYLFKPGAADPVHFSRANGLSHKWVRCLCEDHEGNLWAGTGAGLDALRPRKVQMLAPPDEWQGCSVLSFSVEPDGSAWVGTEGAGLYHFAQGVWTTCGEPCGIANPFVWSVLRTRDNRILAGTWGGGLVVQRGDHFETAAPDCNFTQPITALFEARRGALWVGTGSGLYRLRNGRITWSAGKDKLLLPDVRAIAESDGTVWFGMSGGGLGSLKNGVLKQVLKTNGVGSDFVLSLLPETDGTLWMGTSDNGLVRLRNGKFSAITKTNGLPTSIIYHVVDDHEGNLWLGSQEGILRAAKADLNRCADGLADTIPVFTYGERDGLTARSCTGGFQPGACRSPDGKLWFPTTKGLAVVDPGAFPLNPVPPQVHIEELLIDGRPVPLPAPSSHEPRLRIPAGKRSFQFRFTALSFAAPEKVRFKHKLENLDPDWIERRSPRFVEYSYLRPGDYTFRVLACNNDGIWNTQGAALQFTVLPYFWQTWWFQSGALLGAVVAFTAGALALARRRLRHKLDQLERQRSLERERARIARDIHDDLGASLTRISMLSQSVRAEVAERPEVAADIDQIYGTARELTRAMDEIVWAVNPRHDTLDSLVTYLGRYAQHFLSSASIRCRLDVPVSLPPWTLTSEVRHNVYLAVKEILNNIIRHAKATETRVSLELDDAGFNLLIADNGQGFDLQKAGKTTSVIATGPKHETSRFASGNGLANIRRRLEEIGGSCEWATAPGEGTRVSLSVPVAQAFRGAADRHQNS